MLASIPSPPNNGLHLGPLFVHAYGLTYVVAVVAAVLIASRRWERQGGSRDLVLEVALWGFPAGLIGGRLYFLATSWSEVPDHWWGPLAVWQGGLGIWGGIAAGTLAGLVVLRRRRADIPRFLDAAAPGLLVAQAIGRIGNYFNQELFGGPTSVPWAIQIDPAHRPVGYEQYATFHPTFLYEIVWNLGLAGALVWLGHHRRIRAPGLFALYVAGYSLGRTGEELLRVDPAHHLLGLRLNFCVATLLFSAGVVWFARLQGWRPSLRWTRQGTTLLVGGAIVLSGCGHAAGMAKAATGDSARTHISSRSSASGAIRVEVNGRHAACEYERKELSEKSKATKPIAEKALERIEAQASLPAVAVKDAEDKLRGWPTCRERPAGRREPLTAILSRVATRPPPVGDGSPRRRPPPCGSRPTTSR
jgi:prolipoprotein diacylglyceryl transferase